MTTRIVSFPYGNVLARGTVALGNGTASTEYPITNLYDSDPGTPTVLTASTRSSIDIDCCIVANPGFEDATSSGAPSSWSVLDVGSITQSTTEFYTGAASMLITSSDLGITVAYQDIEAKPGETLGWSAAGKVAASSQGVYVKAQNLDTGNYCSSSGMWSASAQTLGSLSSTTWGVLGGTFTVEGFSTVRKSTTTIRLSARNKSLATAVNAFVDNLATWPNVDMVSVHGHNIPPSVTVDLVSDATTSGFGSASTQSAAVTVLQPAFYAVLSSAINARWIRLDLNDPTAVSNISIGEVVIGLTTSVSAPRHTSLSAWQLGEQLPQIRQTTQGGTIRSLKLLDQPMRVLSLPHLAVSSSDHQTIRDEIYRRTDFGTHPLVLIPWDSESVVLFGRIDNQATFERSNPDRYAHSIAIVELPGPVVGL